MSKAIKKFYFEFASAFSSFKKFENAFKTLKKKLKISDEDYYRIYLSSSEAFVNAIVHGNKLDPKKKVKVVFEVYKKSYVVEVYDEGEGFDVNLIPDPRERENLLKESGRGILIIKSIADGVSFKKTTYGMKVRIKIKKRPSA
jgi:serine/threonine-protein kinase RsbW